MTPPPGWLPAIVDTLSDAVTSTDLDGVVVTWNRAAEDLYGIAAAEAVGRPAAALLPDWAGEIGEMLRVVAAGGTVRIDDGSLTRRDGTAVSIEFTATPIRSSAGDVVGQVSVAVDISAHRRAEERFRQLVRGAPDAMVIVDAAGTIVEVNEQTERLFGHAGADLVGQPVEILVPDRLRPLHVTQRQAFLGRPTVHGMGVGLAITGRRRDGSEFPIEVSLAPLDVGPDRLVSASVRDVTDRQRAERDLARARDEAVAAAQLKSQFVAMVSHEIRTPMNGVLGLTDLLLDTPLDVTQRRYVETIGTSGRALLTIINDILDFSKMESGRIELASADLDLHLLLEEVTTVAAELARDKDIVVTGYHPPALPRVVRGDAGRLRQALLNLVGNAVKFTRKGSVLVTAEPSGGAGVEFAVTDTGIGIAPGDVERLLEPFAQGDDTADRRFGGTGLGLAICRNLVELMGGRLEVWSEVGRGSRFSFGVLLPVTSLGLETEDGLAGRRMLIADGNATTLQFIDEHARSWGMETAPCADSAAAMGALRAASAAGEPFDAAVLDQSMFGADGLSLVDAVAAEQGLGVGHVIVLTSGAYLSDLVAKRTGSVDVLARPVRVSQLFDSLIGGTGRGAVSRGVAPARNVRAGIGGRGFDNAPDRYGSPSLPTSLPTSVPPSPPPSPSPSRSPSLSPSLPPSLSPSSPPFPPPFLPPSSPPFPALDRSGAASTMSFPALDRPGGGGTDSVSGPSAATVLVAEDNEVNQLVAVGTLAALGYRCEVARNGADAVRLAAAGGYAAVLMDCQMPEMDGYAATAEIRRAGDRVPIIAMTAGALAEDRERCLAAGMDDFVSKPIDRDVLRGVLERWATPDRSRPEANGTGELLPTAGVAPPPAGEGVSSSVREDASPAAREGAKGFSPSAREGAEGVSPADPVDQASGKRFPTRISSPGSPDNVGTAVPGTPAGAHAAMPGRSAAAGDASPVAGAGKGFPQDGGATSSGTPVRGGGGGAAGSASPGGGPWRQSLPALRDAIAGRLALLRNHRPPDPGDLAGRVLAAFRNGVPERLDELSTALRIGDVEPLRRHAHDLVGMAGHLGAEDLAALALALQDAARAGDLSAAGELVPRVRAECNRVNIVTAGLV